MQPTQATLRRVNRMNERLRVELGPNPLYIWLFSEFPRKVRMDVTPAGIHLPTPQEVETKLFPMLDHQWVLCVQQPNGNFAPCSGAKGYVGTRKFHDPTWDDTQEVIKIIRAERELSQQDKDQMTIDAMARKAQGNRQRLVDYIASKAPAFGGLPGSKDHRSWGGIGEQRYDPK